LGRRIDSGSASTAASSLFIVTLRMQPNFLEHGKMKTLFNGKAPARDAFSLSDL
jgi:hypothetical protein